MKQFLSLPSLENACATFLFAMTFVLLISMGFLTDNTVPQMAKTRSAAILSYAEVHHTGIYIGFCHFTAEEVQAGRAKR